MQTRFGVPGGNCFETAVACIIEDESLATEYVGEEGWYDRIIQLLDARGYALVFWKAGSGDEPKGLAVAGGLSPAGNPHSVVWDTDHVAHDPHPRNTGLATITEWFLIYHRAMTNAELRALHEAAKAHRVHDDQLCGDYAQWVTCPENTLAEAVERELPRLLKDSDEREGSDAHAAMLVTMIARLRERLADAEARIAELEKDLADSEEWQDYLAKKDMGEDVD